MLGYTDEQLMFTCGTSCFCCCVQISTVVQEKVFGSECGIVDCHRIGCRGKSLSGMNNPYGWQSCDFKKWIIKLIHLQNIRPLQWGHFMWLKLSQSLKDGGLHPTLVPGDWKLYWHKVEFCLLRSTGSGTAKTPEKPQQNSIWKKTNTLRPQHGSIKFT